MYSPSLKTECNHNDQDDYDDDHHNTGDYHWQDPAGQRRHYMDKIQSSLM